MHVHPVAPISSGRGSRARRILSVAAPVVILIAVAGISVLDTNRAPAPTERTVPEDEQADAEPSATTPPTAFTPYPTEVLGIRVIDVQAARRLALANVDPRRLVAVDGWLTMAPDDPACRTPWRDLCRRTGMLSTPTRPIDSSLFVETRPGATLPGLNRLSPRLGSWTMSVPAVIVGRFADRIDRECGLRRPRCEPVFTIEHVAWIESAERSALVATEAGLTAASSAADVERAARTAVSGAGAVLHAALVTRATLELVDPSAAALLGPPATGPVWYVRSVAFNARQDNWFEPVIGWAVVDDATGLALASEPDRVSQGGWRP